MCWGFKMGGMLGVESRLVLTLRSVLTQVRSLAFVLKKLLLGLSAGVTGADLPSLKSALLLG